GVEYVYSTTRPGSAMLIVRFLVGTPPEEALVRLYNKLYANFDKIPPGVSRPLIKPHSIDDVPILSLTFSSPTLSAMELRQLMAQLEEEVKQVDNVSETTLLGGQRRQVRIELTPARLAAYGLSAASVRQALESQNSALQTGSLERDDKLTLVRTGDFLRSAAELKSTVVAVHQGKPVYLRDVAHVLDGPEEPAALVFMGNRSLVNSAVTLAVAKRRGSNAITVAQAVLAKLKLVSPRFLPHDVTMTVTRNYGETALERSNELLVHMGIAVLSVTALIFFSLGHREAVVVAIAIPITLALTLATFVFYKFTLNRVTFFALIFSIGILVDDAIVVVENIVRHRRLPENQGRPAGAVVLEAVAEVGNPTILATLAVMAAILPMAFVGGLMGPYMLPIPLGASAAMFFSMLVAFTVVPWAALRILKEGSGPGGKAEKEDRLTHFYRWGMGLLLHRALYRWLFLAGILVLLGLACSLMLLRGVIFKMLPFDNKSEFQVLVNMPEGTTLERTAAVTQALAQEICKVSEVTDYQLYVGTSAPFNFNGLVRHYFLRSGPNVADIQVNLLPKAERKRQSHDIAKNLRPSLTDLARQYGAKIQVAEIPPGPPVLQTLVTEVYGPQADERMRLAREMKALFEGTEGVVDVDWYVEAAQAQLQVEVDREEAALSGVSPAQINEAVDIALRGRDVGLLHVPSWREDIPVTLRFPPGYRSDWNALRSL
ncbi:unnamed protein product, partial [Phaeothamnion confervicola]